MYEQCDRNISVVPTSFHYMRVMNVVCAGYIWGLHTHVIVVVNIISATIYLIGSGDCCVMGGVLAKIIEICRYIFNNQIYNIK
jgi:hypothetical protein